MPTDCPNCDTDFNHPDFEGHDPERHDWIETDDGYICPTCGTEVADGDDEEETSGAADELRDLLEVEELSGLGPLADELKPQPLAPIAVAGLAEAIDELAGGNTATYVNTAADGINRVAVVTDDFTVRVLMLTSTWKWRGPYTPDDPEGWLTGRGYVPAPEVSADA